MAGRVQRMTLTKTLGVAPHAFDVSPGPVQGQSGVASACVDLDGVSLLCCRHSMIVKGPQVPYPLGAGPVSGCRDDCATKLV